MKYFQIILVFFFVVSCKQEQKKQYGEPEHHRTNPSSIHEKDDVIEESRNAANEQEMMVDTLEETDTKQEWYEDGTLEDKSHLTDLPLQENLVVQTEEQLKVLKAFELFLKEDEEFSIDQVNTLHILNTDPDGNKEVVLEYSVIVYPGTDTWGLRFLYGIVRNGKIEKKAHEFVGGKGDGTTSFKKIDDEGFFWFDTISYAETDAMCCPSIKGETKYKLYDGKFTLVEK